MSFIKVEDLETITTKSPKLGELCILFTGKKPEGLHDGEVDVRNTFDCFTRMILDGIIILWLDCVILICGFWIRIVINSIIFSSYFSACFFIFFLIWFFFYFSYFSCSFTFLVCAPKSFISHTSLLCLFFYYRSYLLIVIF